MSNWLQISEQVAIVIRCTSCNCQTLYKLWQADARFDSSCPGEESTSCLCSSNWRTQTCRASWSRTWGTETCRAHWRTSFAWPQHVGPEHIQTDASRHVEQVGSEHDARRHVGHIEELTLLDHNKLVRNIFELSHGDMSGKLVWIMRHGDMSGT